MRDVVGNEGLYKVTSCGKVWSCRRQKFMKPYGGEGDYKMIGLWDENKQQHFDYIHRLVAKAYIPNPNNYPEINHKDEVKDHNWVENLEWCTRDYNLTYGTRLERAKATGMSRGRVSKKVYCVELDTVFPSVNEAARAIDSKQPNVSATCNGRQKTCGGYHFRFAE